MKVVFLVPRRKDDGHRDRLWEWCKARWTREFPDIPIVEGHHDDGPFNRSEAINTAATLAGDWDLGIVIDSDVFLRTSQVQAAIKRAAKTGKVTWAHRRWRGLAEDHTERVVKYDVDFGAEFVGHDMDVLVERTNPISWSCCIVIPRAVWDSIGGFDQRFAGWGWEDMAWQSVVCGLHGFERVEGDVYHCWHPRSEERVVLGQSRVTASPEYITNARLGRRYMVALRRDHKLTERLIPAGPAELERDIANLKHDDAKFQAAGNQHKLPDWSDWWPTLEELRDGAKAYRTVQYTGTVTVVMTSGGTAETWPVRRAYLRDALASLTEHVGGTIVQRVVYSDWPEELASEVEAIAREFGFYVVGGTHVGYTEMRQRLWKYLARRSTGSFIFATEDDFVFTRAVDLGPMIDTLARHRDIVQVALLRDAFYAKEREAGGILGHPETAFTRRDGWLEHRLFYTANSSLFRKSLTDIHWPSGEHSETAFGKALFANPKTRAAFWGQGEEWIRHVGEVRAGTGY